MDFTKHLSSAGKNTPPDPVGVVFGKIAELRAAGKTVTSFAAGAPDPSLFPADKLVDLNARALAAFGPTMLQYGPPDGFPPLLKLLREKTLPERGVNVGDRNIYVTTGAQTAIHVAGMALAKEGGSGIVLMEERTYPNARDTFRALGLKIVGVPTDNEGMIPADLEEAITTHNPDFIYAVWANNNPTGTRPNSERLQQVAEILKKHDTFAVEDDAYGYLSYDENPTPPLQSFAPDNVLYIGTFSKTIFPGIRVGYAVAPQPIATANINIELGTTMQPSLFTQALAATFLDDSKEDLWTPQLKRVHDLYRTRLDILDKALTKHMPEGYTWTKPVGGLFVWITGPKDLKVTPILDEILEKGVACVPGTWYDVDPSDEDNHIRLSITAVDNDAIEPAVKVMADTLRAHA